MDPEKTGSEDGSPGPGEGEPILEKGEITSLLAAWRAGQQDVVDELMPLVYDHLYKIASRHMAGERSNHTLQPTAVVNEAYLRLLKLNRIGWQDRSHFFAISARLIRRILVDHARHHSFAKRGGGRPDLPIAEARELIIERPEEMVQLDQALQGLERFDGEKALIVELKFFGGLSNDEIAEIQEVSRTTVVRHWRVAKAWLFRELSREE